MQMKQGPNHQHDEHELGEQHHDAFEWTMIDEQSEHNELLSDFRRNNLAVNDDIELGNGAGQQVKQTDLSKYDLRSQPFFHRRNKNFAEKCCKCFTENCDLNRREIKYYYKFKEEMVQPYDEKNQHHERMLKEFYMRIFNHDEANVPDRLLSHEWKEIGFQSQNPRTDFRGGGVLALHCLRYYTSVYPGEFAAMRNDKTDTFFIAITSINITHMLITYFYMNKEEVPESSKRLRTGRKQFKRFSRLNSVSKKTFYELHAFLFTFLYRLWIEEYNKVKPRMPVFNSILDTVRQQLHQYLMSDLFSEVEIFRAAWNGYIAIKFSRQSER